jgi:signal transduction histidine kinase
MSAALEHFRILVADDERAVLDAYRTVLSDINAPHVRDDKIESLEARLFGAQRTIESGPTFTSVLCRGGEEAVEAMRGSTADDPPFPVAFLDVRMPPGIDGIETAARIRALDPEINIVIVTAYADSHPREIAQRVPPLDKLFYISKPFQKMELQQFVLALTAKWKAERGLRAANLDLEERCRELEAAHAELIEAQRRAEMANRCKSEFVANMSHELRTPLNAVIGFTDVIRNETFGPIGNGRYRQYIDDISHSGVHLLRMINELLDFAKIDAGKLEVQFEEVNPLEVIGSVMPLVELQAEQAGIKLHVDDQAEPPLLLADPHRLRQVLINLLSNAIKFTPAGGRVRVMPALDGDGSFSIAVADTGIGMSAKDVAIALEPFGQVEQGIARKYQGTGLGLTIAKKLAELQGGRLDIESEVGKGTTVHIRFPSASCKPRPGHKRVA